MGDVSINVDASWGNSVDTPKSADIEVPALHVGSTDGNSLDQGAASANAPAASMSDQEGDEQMAVDEPAAAGDFSEEVAAPTPPHPHRPASQHSHANSHARNRTRARAHARAQPHPRRRRRSCSIPRPPTCADAR